MVQEITRRSVAMWNPSKKRQVQVLNMMINYRARWNRRRAGVEVAPAEVRVAPPPMGRVSVELCAVAADEADITLNHQD